MSARSVPSNAVTLLVGRIVGAGASIVVVSLAAHRLDQPQFGLAVSVMAAGFLANTLVTFGTDTVVTRSVAAESGAARSTMTASLQWQLGAAAVLIAMATVAVLMGADLAILVQSAALAPLAVVTVMGAALRGAQRMDQLLVASTSGALTGLGAAIVLFSVASEPWVPIAAFAIGSGVTAAVSSWFVRRLLLATGEFRSIRSLLWETLPFAGMVGLAAVGAQAGLLLVEFLADETAGGYGAALRLSEAARLVPAALMGAVFPALVAGLERDHRYQRWLRLMLGYSVVATLGLVVLAQPLNRLMFDSQPDGAALIRLLSLGLILTVFRLALSFELIAANRESTVLVSAVIGALATVVGGVVLVGPFGARGVAVAQLVGLGLVVGWLMVNRVGEMADR